MTISLKAAADGLSGTIQVGGVDKMRFGADTSGQPFSFRNLLVNSTFQVNNGNAGTPYISAAVLAAGTYGHEMWKAGASGGDYSFTQNPAITTITIASGKSLIQVIEDKFVEGGDYILSWTGTAQARVTINSATPSGAYAASPILVTGQTAGTTMCVEFNTGTLSKAQLEVGSIATKFEFRQDELQRTQRYAEFVGSGGVGSTSPNPSACQMSWQYKVSKRSATQSLTHTQSYSVWSPNIGGYTVSGTGVANTSIAGLQAGITLSSAPATGGLCLMYNSSGDAVFVSCRL